MAQLLVRGLDKKMIDRLKQRAKRNARSLEAEARVILSEAEPDQEAFDLAVASAAEMRRATAGRIKGDSADLIREWRDR